VVAVVVVAAVAIAALAAAGVLHFGSTGSSPPANETFSQALGVAQSKASSQAGGPWTAVAGAALVSTLEVTEPSANLTTLEDLTNCNLTWVGGQPSDLIVPATPSGTSIGTSAFWSFALKNESNALLVETVSQGSASALLTLTGGDCATAGSALDGFTSGMPDSPAIIAAVNANGGAAFIGAHANASELWSVDGGFTFLGISTTPEWFVEYTSCSATASPTQTGAVFNATVNGLSAIVTENASGTAECALSVSTGPTLAAPTSFLAILLRKAI
jgi:hypothetical protein